MGLRVVFQPLAWAAALLAPLPWALAQPAAPAAKPIYSCIDGTGKLLTRDRPIAECLDRPQRMLNADGSVRDTLPPTMTALEREIKEAHERDEKIKEAERQDAIRRDRNLLARYPTEAAHHKAREAALDDVRKAVTMSEARMALLAVERKPLQDESEFYLGKPLPLKLRTQLDANDAATDAQRTIAQNQQAEVVRINRRYDGELDRLRKLWSGAPPGSIGTLPATASAGSSSTAR